MSFLILYVVLNNFLGRAFLSQADVLFSLRSFTCFLTFFQIMAWCRQVPRHRRGFTGLLHQLTLPGSPRSLDFPQKNLKCTKWTQLEQINEKSPKYFTIRTMFHLISLSEGGAWTVFDQESEVDIKISKAPHPGATRPKKGTDSFVFVWQCLFFPS